MATIKAKIVSGNFVWNPFGKNYSIMCEYQNQIENGNFFFRIAFSDKEHCMKRWRENSKFFVNLKELGSFKRKKKLKMH